VINDGTTDKTFKYSLNGALFGNWSIDEGNYQQQLDGRQQDQTDLTVQCCS